MKTTRTYLLFIITMLFVVACGGGSEPLSREETGDTSTPEVDQSIQTIQLGLVDANSEQSTMLTSTSPLNIVAQVTDSDGAAVVNELVSFVLSTPELANFGNDTGTALTNDEGIAILQLAVGSISGSGTVTASVENASSVSVGFESVVSQQARASSFELFASSVQLASSGSDEIELIAVVKNEQNILLSGVPVFFEANQNASLTITNAETQADGTARALLTTTNNPENRTITVTASIANLPEPRTLDIVVRGTELNIDGDSAIIINDSAPITFALTDSDGNGIANQEINISTTIGVMDQERVTTGPNGQITVGFRSSTSGEGSIIAESLSVEASLTIVVQEDNFSFTDIPDTDLDLNTDHNITVGWFKDNVPFSGGAVTVTSSRGEISVGGDNTINQVNTAADGLATFSINSQFAGPASISAVGLDNNGNQVTARAELNFVSDNVDTIFVDATPDFIGPDGQTSTITAVLRDERGNLVQNKTVNFRLVADSSGGSISLNTALTNSNGMASTVYTSNAVSADNGVIIGAESDGIESTTELSVGDRAFDIVIGTGNDLIEEDNTSFIKEFSVFVTDASGRPVSDAELTASSIPTETNTYRKGFFVWDDANNINVAVVTTNPACISEDINKNGILDDGEDANGDGLLTPGNVATVNFKDNITRTNEFGQAIVQVRYPQQNGQWSSIKLTVSGQSEGSESSASQSFVLPVLSDDLTNEANPPPSSPFGFGANCNDTI